MESEEVKRKKAEKFDVFMKKANEYLSDSENIALAALCLLSNRCKDLGISDMAACIMLNVMTDQIIQDMKKEKPEMTNTLEHVIKKHFREHHLTID